MVEELLEDEKNDTLSEYEQKRKMYIDLLSEDPVHGFRSLEDAAIIYESTKGADKNAVLGDLLLDAYNATRGDKVNDSILEYIKMRAPVGEDATGINYFKPNAYMQNVLLKIYFERISNCKSEAERLAMEDEISKLANSIGNAFLRGEYKLHEFSKSEGALMYYRMALNALANSICAAGQNGIGTKGQEERLKKAIILATCLTHIYDGDDGMDLAVSEDFKEAKKYGIEIGGIFESDIQPVSMLRDEKLAQKYYEYIIMIYSLLEIEYRRTSDNYKSEADRCAEAAKKIRARIKRKEND